MPARIAIIEDDKNYNNALRKILEYDANLECVAQYFDATSAIIGLPSLSPDVVLVDIKLPDSSGIEVVSELKNNMEDTHFMMCTSFEDDEHIYKALKSGASGYLIKGEPLDKIIDAVKDVMKGGAPMSFGVAKKVLHHFRETKKPAPELQELTNSENDVLEMLSQGLLYKEIAEKKFVTLDTIKKHVGNIYRKLHVSNKIEAINLLNKNKI